MADVTGRSGDAAALINPASPLPIPPHDGASTPGLLSSTLASAVIGTLSQLRVNVDVDPSNVFFSSLTLKHPDATSVVLYPYGAGVNSFGSRLSGTQFADSAASAFSAGSSPYAGIFRPSGSLGSLVGKPTNGTWTIEARSWLTGSPQVGLSGWSIQFGADSPAANPLDFNTDGKPDILWRNTSTGDNYVWYMNGIARAGGD